MRRIRGKNIDEATVQIIVGVLDAWSGKLTWELLTQALLPLIGHKYTRQTLSKVGRVALAFETHKKRLNESFQPATESDLEFNPELYILSQQYERLKAENYRLRAEITAFRETFTTWAYNAAIRGLSGEYLNTAIPKVDREQTKEAKSVKARESKIQAVKRP